MNLKLNKVIYSKLVAQAAEAREQGMLKLANGVLNAVGAMPADEHQECSYKELQDSIYNDLWKVATRITSYYNLSSFDVEKVEQDILSLAADLTTDLEEALNVERLSKKSLDPKVFGEK